MRPLRTLAAACCFLSAPLFGEDQPPSVPAELVPLTLQAKAQFNLGKYAEAEKTYRSLLAKAPDNLEILSNLGVVLFRARKFKLAQDTFEKIVAAAPGDGFAHCTLGIIYYDQGGYDHAVAELTRALKIDVKNATAHNYLGLVASQRNQSETARKELETAITLDPRYADAQFNLAVAFATQKPIDKETACKYYGRARDLGAERDAALEALIGWYGGDGGVTDAVSPKALK